MAYPAVLWIAVAAALLGAFEYGYSMGVLNTVLDTIAGELSFDSSVGGAVVVSVLLLGAATGALGAGVFADAVGTKRSQVLNALFFIVGGALSAVTTKSQFCWTGFGQMNGCVPTALFIGRVITGVGAGCASLFTPRYLAEISPVKYRGVMGGWYQVMVNVGILGGYLVALPYGFDFSSFTLSGVSISWWRVMLALTIVPGVLQIALFTFCPESPVWLEWKGRKSEAAAVRLALWGEQGNWLAEPLLGSVDSPRVGYSHIQSRSHGRSHSHGNLSSHFSHHHHHHHYHGRPTRSRSSSHLSSEDNLVGMVSGTGRSNSSSRLHYPEAIPGALSLSRAVSLDMSCSSMYSLDSGDALFDALVSKECLDEKQGSAEGWGALLKKKYRWMVVLSVGIPMLQQLSGVNTVVLYSSQLFTQAGVNNALAGTIYTGVVNVVFTAISSPFVDHYGRRPMLLTSFLGMTACLAGLATSSRGSASWMGTVSLVCILGYMMFFAGGAGPIPWTYLAEILPASIKGRLAALSTALAWVVNLAIGMTFPIMLGSLGVSICYYIYAGLNILAVVFIYFLLVETKCMTMEQIHQKLLLAE